METWEIIKTVIYWIIILNVVGAVFTVFREKRDIAATWAWLLVLVLLPVVGFIAYAFIGRKLSHRRLDRINEQTPLQLKESLEAQKREIGMTAAPMNRLTAAVRSMILLFQNIDHAYLTQKNKVQIFNDGNQLFDQLLTDIQHAKHSIHIEFYTFYNDQIGNQIREALELQAQNGLEVRVIYDSWGSMGTKRSFFDQLRQHGGEAEPFLGVGSNLRDFRLNFRDHRKIVVIDGQIGYVGGFNIGDQYLGRSAKFGYWRDTHLKIIGAGTFSLQQRFILDWNVTSKNHPLTHYRQYFPVNKMAKDGNTSMQIVSSGPESDVEQVKMGYLKLINSAKERLWIQSPYLIPDDSVLDALKVAIQSGVDVRIMIPCKPDHAFVYRASQYYARQLAEAGATIYTYDNGFLHAKTMVADGMLSSVGSANMDFRSFKLNFEINAFMYDEQIAQQLEKLYLEDIEQSTVMTIAAFKNQSLWLRFKQTFSRLLSPIL